MIRKTVNAVLLLVALLGYSNILGNEYQINESTRGLDVAKIGGITPSYGGRGAVEDFRLSRVEAVLHNSATYYPVMRLVEFDALPERYLPSRLAAASNPTPAPNPHAMVIVGLGIVLLSSIRRMGPIRI